MTDAVNLLPKERELIRREFMWRLSSARSLHDGILLKRRATDARKGEPKVPPAVQSLLDRGLVVLGDLDHHGPTARFTDRGFAALKRLARDPRALPARDYRHLLDEIAALGDGSETT
jgi:hypothetical protein